MYKQSGWTCKYAIYNLKKVMYWLQLRMQVLVAEDKSSRVGGLRLRFKLTMWNEKKSYKRDRPNCPIWLLVYRDDTDILKEILGK